MKSTKGKGEKRDACGADFCSTFCFVLRDSRTLERVAKGKGKGKEEERWKKKRFMRLFLFLSLAYAPFATKEKKGKREANQGPGTAFQE